MPEINEAKKELQDSLINYDEDQFLEFRDLLQVNPLDKKKLKELIPNGIPSEIQRRMIWKILLNYDKKTPTVKELLEIEIENRVDNDIKQDVRRTFTEFKYFREQGKPHFETEGQRDLYTVLRCYAAFDKEISYCQGMAFVAAILLIHFDVENTLKLFISLMHQPKFGLRELYLEDLRKLKCLLNCVKKLMDEKTPKLSHYLEQNEIGIELISTHFIATIFCVSFHLKTITRIWDIFLLERWDFAVRFIVGIMKKLENKLLKTPFIAVQQTVNQYCLQLKPEEIYKISKTIDFSAERLEFWMSKEVDVVVNVELKRRGKINAYGYNSKDQIFANIQDNTYETKLEKKTEEKEENIDSIFEDFEQDKSLDALLKTDTKTKKGKKKKSKGKITSKKPKKRRRKKKTQKQQKMRKTKKNADELNLDSVSKLSNFLDGLEIKEEGTKNEEESFFDF